MRRLAGPVLSVLLGFSLAVACTDDDDGGESAGEQCAVPEECYQLADPEEIQGEIQCLDRVPGGYCTHLCQTDDDCCAAEGECDGRPQVCAPFESTGMMMCFLSCEDADLDGFDETEYCNRYAHPSFSCRSTGGGSANRKVCA